MSVNLSGVDQGLKDAQYVFEEAFEDLAPCCGKHRIQGAIAMRKNIMIVVAMLAVIAGCQSNPAPPTVDNAKAVWHNTVKLAGLAGDLELVDLKKTDGQMAEVNGTKVYTLFYVVREKHLTKMGDWKPGDIETVKSNYGFQKTENGWQGPDGEHFPN